MVVVFDASAVFPLLVTEEKTGVVCEIYAAHQNIIFLDFLRIEIVNGLASAVRRRRFDQAYAFEAMEKLSLITRDFTSADQYLAAALVLAFQINHPVYDCLYAAAALSHNATLITCDAKFAAKLDLAAYKVQVV